MCLVISSQVTAGLSRNRHDLHRFIGRFYFPKCVTGGYTILNCNYDLFITAGGTGLHNHLGTANRVSVMSSRPVPSIQSGRKTKQINLSIFTWDKQ